MTVVGMLDPRDHTLHRPSSEHLRSVCGLTYDLRPVTIGPAPSLARSARQLCPDCWPREAIDE